MKTIFTVTSIAIIDNKISTRNFGFFFEQEKAINAVLKNTLDIFEHRYEYAVIEEVSEGIHANLGNEIWFKWNWDKKKYEKSKKPSLIEDVYWFGMG